MKSNNGKNRSWSPPASLQSPIKLYEITATRRLLKYALAEDSLKATYGTDVKRKKNHVTFTTVEIREYARTIGDNPSCTSGPPVGISWEYAPSDVLPLDSYEKHRPPRRTNTEMMLPRHVRQHMLRKEWGFTEYQIAAQIRKNIRIKNNRRTTVNNLDKSNKVEEVLENLKRFILSHLCQCNTEKEMRRLQDQLERAQQAQKQQAHRGSGKPETTLDESSPEFLSEDSSRIKEAEENNKFEESTKQEEEKKSQ